MTKKVFLLSLLCALMAVFSLQTAMAYNPNWKADQDKMFEQIKLKPGDVIDTKNWQKVESLLPASVVNYVKTGDFVLKIGEMKYDYGMDEAWEKASEANRGKYTLGTRKEIVDKATGKFPMYIYGKPFPDFDMKDPDLGAKVMHTKTVEEARAGKMYQDCGTVFVGEGGIERKLYNMVYYEWFWSRPDGEQANPNDYKFTEVIRLTEPYDLAGTVVLTLRPLDGSPDRSGTYVPALRRVRRTSGTSRSDPFFGSDVVNDDAGGWGGQNETMSWKVVGEKIALIPKAEWQAESPDKLRKQPNGSWKASAAPGYLNLACMVKDPQRGKVNWAPQFIVWVPRKIYLIEATPLDPYYNYGKCLYYVDAQACVPVIKIVHNKAGEYWKTIFIDQFAQQWGDDNKMIIDQQGFYLVMDDKTHHATFSPVRGVFQDWDFPLVIMDPNMKPEMFTFEKIATMSK